MGNLNVLASCYPNCHPAGQATDAVTQSGNIALGAAVILLLILFLTRKKSGR